METDFSVSQKRKTYRSLLLLAVSLKNCFVTVDLRNESSVSGRILQVDQQMNITFEDAAFVEEDTGYKYFSKLFIPSRMIRNIVIPDNVSILDLIHSMLPKKKEKALPAKKPMTLKRRRALTRQAEAMKLIKEFQEKKTERS